jgi:hypothetical protein
MLKLINHQLEEGDSKRQSLNYFLFSYFFRGMNLRDMAYLKWKEKIIDDKIFFVRTKTASTRSQTENIIIKIEPQIEQILSRNRSEATTKAYLDKFEQTEIDNTFRHLV